MVEDKARKDARRQAFDHVVWFVSCLQMPIESEFARAARQAIKIPLTAQEYEEWYADLLALARQAFQDRVRSTYEAGQQTHWYARFEGNTEADLEIVGSERLRTNSVHILELVRETRAFRYRQIIQSFKRLELVAPEAVVEDWTGYRPAYRMGGLRANSNGYFTIDGGEVGSEEFWCFVRTFLHECGHNVHGHFLLEVCAKKTSMQREREARSYAEIVLAEIAFDIYQQQLANPRSKPTGSFGAGDR